MAIYDDNEHADSNRGLLVETKPLELYELSVVDDEELSEEEISVRLWRFEQLLAHGYCEADASAVARDTSIDLELARRLVRRGCPPAIATRILV